MMKKIFISTFLLPTFTLASSGSIDRSVLVNGQCVKNLDPDRSSLRLTVETIEPTVTASTQKAQKQYEILRKEIKSLNLKEVEIETQEYSVNEDISWDKNKKKVNGFKTRMGIFVSTSEIQKIGEVMVKASNLGIQEVYGLSTYVSSAVIKQEKENCLAEAVQNARKKAERMAEAGKTKVGAVIELTEIDSPNSQNPIMPRMMMAKSVTAETTGAAPQIETQKVEISLNVQARFKLTD